MLNREFRIRAVKPKKTEDTELAESKTLHPDTVKLVAERTVFVVKRVALTAIAAYAAVKAIDTLSQIAIIKTENSEKED